MLKHITSLFWRASVASETVLGVDNAKSGICYWRASVASETLTGVKMKKSGMFVYLYICMDVRKAFLYFDPRVFFVSSVVDPVPNCTKQNPLVYRSVPVSP